MRERKGFGVSERVVVGVRAKAGLGARIMSKRVCMNNYKESERVVVSKDD